MSTKNLARTVIEGGRTQRSKLLRRLSTKRLRLRVRRTCQALVLNPGAEESVNWPVRYRDYCDIEHADKIAPCERFLEARAGRPWNDVRSEICRRFDRRKLAGRHVTNFHLLNRVETARCWSGWHGDRKFWVDDRGVLRRTPSMPW